MFQRLSVLRVALAIPIVSITGLQIPLTNTLTTSSPTTTTTQPTTTTTQPTTTTTPPSVATTTPEADADVLLGIFDAYAGSGDFHRVDAIERWQQRGHAVVGLYTNFAPAEMQRAFAVARSVWDHGNVPMISWMPWIGNTKGVDYSAMIAAGSHDAYLRDWAGAARTFIAGPDDVYGTGDDRRLYLRFAHEANGHWYPYAPAYGRTPASSFVAMWRHVHDAFVTVGIDDPTRLAWVFAANNVDSWREASAEALYPGDAYVDWIAVDGYNWGTSEGHTGWASPGEVFDDMVARLRRISSRPLAVTEVGSTIDGATVTAKAAWITDYFEWVHRNDVRLTMWFNVSAPTWEMFGGDHGDETFEDRNAFSSYRTATGDPSVVTADPANPRLLTDAQFAGR